MAERGLSVDHVTIWRWVRRYAPVLNQRIRRELRRPNRSWRVDETYVKVVWAENSIKMEVKGFSQLTEAALCVRYELISRRCNIQLRLLGIAWDQSVIAKPALGVKQIQFFGLYGWRKTPTIVSSQTFGEFRMGYVMSAPSPAEGGIFKRSWQTWRNGCKRSSTEFPSSTCPARSRFGRRRQHQSVARTARPGVAPVRLPTRTTNAPPTITSRMPSDGTFPRSYVERSRTVAGSKIVRSASAPS